MKICLSRKEEKERKRKKRNEKAEQAPISSGSSTNNRWPRRKSASVRYVGATDIDGLSMLGCCRTSVHGPAKRVRGNAVACLPTT